MRVDQFDFELPEELIALRPAAPRDSARLLHVTPECDFNESTVAQLPGLLAPGDVLVLNDTKVIPARLAGRRTGRGGTSPKIEVTLHDRADACRWKAFSRPARKLAVNDTLVFGGGRSPLKCTVEEILGAGEVLLRFARGGAALDGAVAAAGWMPLPPYIASKRAPDSSDQADYQTVYAHNEGAVASPTAGLHFTEALLSVLAERNIDIVFVTLHVGAGTFLPVKAATVEEHRMHAEWGRVDTSVTETINRARARGHRIVAVGTTSLRLLESCMRLSGEISEFEGKTDIFITPGTDIRSADMLFTNFHLPKSTLFMLACAFAGTDCMKRAYAHAIASRFRFYSYGDACLLQRRGQRVIGGGK